MWTRIRWFVAVLVIATGLPGNALLASPAAFGNDGQTEGPGYCWDEYVKEAVAAFDEWVDCHDNVRWYDIGGFFLCDWVYEARAIGAAAWYAKCIGLPRLAEA